MGLFSLSGFALRGKWLNPAFDNSGSSSFLGKLFENFKNFMFFQMKDKQIGKVLLLDTLLFGCVFFVKINITFWGWQIIITNK